MRALALIAIVGCAALAACTTPPHANPIPRGLDSGITSSNGGGERELGNQPNVGITTRAPRTY